MARVAAVGRVLGLEDEAGGQVAAGVAQDLEDEVRGTEVGAMGRRKVVKRLSRPSQ